MRKITANDIDIRIFYEFFLHEAVDNVSSIEYDQLMLEFRFFSHADDCTLILWSFTASMFLRMIFDAKRWMQMILRKITSTDWVTHACCRRWYRRHASCGMNMNHSDLGRKRSAWKRRRWLSGCCGISHGRERYRLCVQLLSTAILIRT